MGKNNKLRHIDAPMRLMHSRIAKGSVKNNEALTHKNIPIMYANFMSMLLVRANIWICFVTFVFVLTYNS